MTSKNIEVQESCDSSIESTVPEHLDAGINNGDDSFETWVSAESKSLAKLSHKIKIKRQTSSTLNIYIQV